MSPETALRYIGKNIPRRDASAKLNGTAKYTDDLRFELPVLHGRVLRSPHAHAMITLIDMTAARALAGVHAVICGLDYPNKIGLYLKDRSIFAMDRVRHIGEPIAAVVADTEEIAEQAIELLRVEFDPLPTVFDAVEAIDVNAPLIHPGLEFYAASDFIYPQAETNISNHFKLRNGSPDEVWQNCAQIVEETFQIPHIQHTPIEPHVGYAFAGKRGAVTLWASVQSPFAQQAMLADWLGIPKEKVRVIAPYIGGGFGSKAGVTMEAIPVAMAMKVPGKIVKFRHTREEEFYGTFVRQAVTIQLKLGCDADGKLLAMHNRMIWNGGAFTEYGVNIARAAGYSCTGPYHIPHVKADSYCVYTNHPVGGAYRGFGMSELHTAVEQGVDQLANAMNMDGLTFRLKNIVQAGEPLATGMVMHPHGLKQCLQAVAHEVNWQEPVEPSKPWKKRGRGIAAVWKAPAMPTTASSEAKIHISAEGILLNIGGQEIGQGTHTAALQIAAETMGVSIDEMQVDTHNDTQSHAYEWQTVASRITWSMGNAICLAGRHARTLLFEKAADLWQESADQLDIRDDLIVSYQSEREISYRALFRKGEVLIGQGNYMPAYLTGLDQETGQGVRPVVHFTVGAQAFDIELDTRSGQVSILKAVSAFDVGKAINPQLVKAQMEGGMLQGISSALFEELSLDQGQILNADFVDYRIATMADIPLEMKTIIVEMAQDDGPWGARGIGEHPMIPTIAALGNAIYDAGDVRLLHPPFSAEKIYLALKQK
ncbi:MAG: xanthine dehydrogenase family protein molybdopterin-binding subunit [Anaerolineaceae bacterium]|nr:xanthine dehydrogenase family protein molybdopterin-binding subunit [Anaerolineaceae bacterium]